MAVAYITAQLCLHIVINCLGLPETYQNMSHLSSYHRPILNSAKFRKNIEIPRKWANSVAGLKIPCAAENCGPYLCLPPRTLFHSCHIHLITSSRFFAVCLYPTHQLQLAQPWKPCWCWQKSRTVCRHNVQLMPTLFLKVTKI